MANSLYTTAKEGFIAGEIDLNTAIVRMALVRGYTANLGTHKFVSDVTGAGGTIPVASPTMTSISIASGIFDAADLTFLAVASGSAIQHVLVFQSSAVTPSNTTISTTGTVGTVTAQAATITGMTTSTGLMIGSPITGTAGTGAIGTGCHVTSIVSGTSVTVLATSGLTAGTVTNIATSDVADSAKRVICLMDTSTGVTLPITPNGGDIVVTWDNGTNKIFGL
jgi:hypothetical protein